MVFYHVPDLVRSTNFARTSGAPPPAPRSTCSRSLAHLDRGSGCRERVPLGAEVVASLARRLARGAVTGERVEGVPVVGDLGGPVAALRGAELRGRHAGACGRLIGRGQRWPRARARAFAHARRSLVRLEEVQGPALRVD